MSTCCIDSRNPRPLVNLSGPGLILGLGTVTAELCNYMCVCGRACARACVRACA